MTPNSLTLKGFRGIRDGLGRDEITLDLDTLAGGAKLIALAGPNGIGKTTVMDNLHPFLVMPSRAGADGLGRFSFYDQVVLVENLKDLVWTHAGIRYRSEVVIRVNGKKKTEAYLYVDSNGAWTPYRLQDGTVSDGRVDTYTRGVEEICGSRETFFTAQFSAQGKRQLSAYDPAEIKTLLADLLGHEEVRKTGQQATKVIDLLKIGITGMRQALAGVEAERTTITAALAGIGDTDARMTALAAERVAAQQVSQTAAEGRARTQADAEAATQNDVRRQQLAAERAALINEGREAVHRLDNQVARETTQRTELANRVATRVTAAAQRRSQIERRLSTLAATIASAPKVEWAKRWQATVEWINTGREAAVAKIRADIQAAEELRRSRKSNEDRVAALEREAGQASLRAAELSKRFGLAEEVPCAGTDLQGQCKLLGDAMAAKPLIPNATADIARLGADKEAVLASIADLDRQLLAAYTAIGAFDAAEARAVLQLAEAKLAATRRRHSRLVALAAREGEISQATAERDVAQSELDALVAAGTGETVEEARQREAFVALIAQLGTERSTLATQYRQRLDAIEATITAMPAPFDAARLQAAEQAVAAAAAEIERIEKEYAGCLRQQQQAAGYQARLTEVDAKVAQQRQRLAEIDAQMSVWTLFGKCMSNDGLIALAIDDAGPTLSALTNDLLLACYGPRFTVSIVTQSQTAKGEMREDFDIIVHDGDSGDSKSVTAMSGGERVWINECLVRAIALYLAQNRARACDTLFSDETDGPLDSERKRMFMAMKLEVLRLGGYQREYFVSQTPELASMADAVIDMAAYRV